MCLKWKLSEVFYGWWIVVACFLISVLMGGFVTLGFTAFFEPIANEFGWSYTQISLAASIRGIEVGLLAPLAGLFMDRWGTRKLAFGGIFITGLGLMLLSFTNSLGIFYGIFALVAIGYSGSSPTVVITAVANWFRKKIGIAMGIIVSGFALGGLLIPIIVKLIDLYDWRTATFILGLGVWVIGLPLSLLLRHKPEQYGYMPDGEKYSTDVTSGGRTLIQLYETGTGTRQAMESRVFWHIAVAVTFQYIAISAVIVHIMPYLSSIGTTRSISSLVATTIPLVSISGRLSSGWLGDRFDKRRVATGAFAFMCLGLIILSCIPNTWMWMVIPFIILFSIGWGANTTMRGTFITEYFGRSHFGSIYGFMTGMVALGSIVGPILAGWVFDNRGSYQIAWLVYACLTFASAIIIATTPPVSTKS